MRNEDVRQLSDKTRLLRRKCRKIWMVWVEKQDHRGQMIADIRSVEESEEGAEFVVDILRAEENPNRIWVEPRVTHHIYGHQDVLLSMRLASQYTKHKRDGD